MLDVPERASVQRALLAWYRKHHRDLPWRHSRDPYRVWVSEAMLQQTRVETAIPYFHRFLRRFPTIDALAAASEAEVLKAWEGLGYYSRARQLNAAAREVRARYGSRVPDDPERFGALPGVGEYTRGAVLSIAYGKPLPAVDGNVLRVLARLLGEEEPIDKPPVRRRLAGAAERLLVAEDPGTWNQAVMELGALICTPGRPRCEACPVATWCLARARGCEAELPRRTARPPLREEHWDVAVLVAPTGRALVRKRPSNGLLANMWEFPAWPCEQADPAGSEARLREYLSPHAEVSSATPLPPVRHAFTHLRWVLHPVLFAVAAECALCAPQGGVWVAGDALAGELALPKAHRQIARLAHIMD